MNKAQMKAFNKFKIKAIILGILIFISAVILIFYCQYNLPLYSEASTVTYKGTFMGAWDASDINGRFRTSRVMVQIGHNVYRIPESGVHEYKYNIDDLQNLLENKTVIYTVSKFETRLGTRTLFEIISDGKKIISAEDIHSYHASCRWLVWIIYSISAVILCFALFQSSSAALPVIKERLRQITEKIKIRK